MRRVEVLHLLGTAAEEGTSIARIVKTLAAELDPAKFRLQAWFLGDDGPLRQELEGVGLVTRVFGWTRGAKDPLGALRFRAALAVGSFDIVHQHFGARSVRWLIRRTSRAALVVNLHGAAADPRVAVVGSDGVLACSRWVADQVDVACEVVYPGVTLPAKATVPRAGPLIIGMASRLVAGKGLFEMLLAMKHLVELGSGACLEIAGDGPLREELSRQIRELDLQERVRLLGWQANMGPLFQRWSLFAMPSVNEGFGMAALEAMAHGLPVVGMRSGALPELIVDQETGLLAEVTEPGSLVSHLARLLENAELRTRLGAASQESVAQRFSPREMAIRTGAFYESLLGLAPGSGQLQRQ